MTRIDLQRTDLLDDGSLPTERESLRITGTSTSSRETDDAIDRAARSDAAVLLRGEAGVGKAFAARLIHRRSRRASAALVTMTCAGLPESLQESELFGHVRGSFTGAFRDKPGMLEVAPGGTLFLAEVGDLSPRVQLALLRFLDSGDIRRVGADRAHLHVDTRVVAASGLDIQARVAEGVFRGDLYAALTAIRITLPALRERREDIPPLVESFMRACGRVRGTTAHRVSSEAMQAMVAYRWPGNVTELKTVVEHLTREGTGPTVRLSDLPISISRGASGSASGADRG